MSKYSYPPLRGASSIRMLRLLPNEDPSAPIKCQLFDYALRENGKRTRLYEALSYVWGSCVKDHLVSIDGCHFAITENLHAALLRLRDHFFDRILWIDAVCIDQRSQEEKERQIGLMGKIYGHASRVIVWLGEEADGSSKALEHLRTAAEGILYERRPERLDSTGSSTENENRALNSLLKRAWFRRMWVLQEVGLAREIIVLCGSVEITGSAFATGINRLNIFDDEDPELPSLIRSVIYLMQGATSRAPHGAYSNHLSLSELVNMYHSHEATLRHDKAFALFGMISDDPVALAAAGLSPKYDIPWHELLRNLVKYTISDSISVETWDDREMAVIKGKAHILGHIAAVESDEVRYGREKVYILGHDKDEWDLTPNAMYTLRASAKSVQKNDIVCLIEGASNPSIIRACKDHFAVIISSVSSQQRIMDCRIQDPDRGLWDLFLIWNWETSTEDRPSQQEHYSLTGRTTDEVDGENIVNMLGIVASAGMDGTETDGLQSMMSLAEITAFTPYPGILEAMERLALAYQRARELHEAEECILMVLEGREQLHGINHPDTLQTLANLASIHMSWTWSESDEMVISLADTIRQRQELSADDVAFLVGCTKGRGGLKVLKALYDQRGELPISEEVLVAAAHNWDSGHEIMKLLFELEGEPSISKEVVEKGAGNAHCGYDIMKFLSERGQFPISEGAVTAAAGNIEHGYNMMKLILDHGGESLISNAVLIEAVANPVSGYEVIELLLARTHKLPISEEVVNTAAANWDRGDRILQSLVEKGYDLPVSDEAIEAAGENKYLGCQILQHLLAQPDGLAVSEEIVQTAFDRMEREHESGAYREDLEVWEPFAAFMETYFRQRGWE